MKYSFVILICLSTVLSTGAQIWNPSHDTFSDLDSIMIRASSPVEDTNKIRSLLRLCNYYLSIKEYNKPLDKALDAVRIVEELNYAFLKAEAYYSLGLILHYQADYSGSLEYINKALALEPVMGDSDLAGWIHKLAGSNLFFLELYTGSVNHFYSALKIFEKSQNKSGIANTLQGLSGAFSEQNRNDEALELNLRALAIFKEINELFRVAQINNSISAHYLAKKDYERSLQCVTEALEVNLALGDKGPVWGLAYSYSCLSDPYEQMGNDEKENGNIKEAECYYAMALDYLNLSLERWVVIDKEKSFQLSPISIGSLYLRMAAIYFKLDQYDLARHYNQAGMEVMKKKNMKMGLSTGYLLASKLDALQHNYKSAYSNYQQHIIYRDSIYNTETSNKISQSKREYDFEKTEHELKLLTAENKLKTLETEKQKQQTALAYTSAGILCLLSIGGYYLLRRNQKIKTEQRTLRDRLTISQDLHDHVGSTLSSITVYSQVAKIVEANHEKEKLTDLLDKIGSASNEMVTEMNDIVWALNPVNDSMEKMLQRMESYARPLAVARNIQCTIAYDPSICQLQLDMHKRKNIYLIFKEAVNNSIKYAGASVLEIKLEHIKNQLNMFISDNGVGFNVSYEIKDSPSSLSGNGLRNMLARAKDIKARLDIYSSPGAGTVHSLYCPLN